MLEDIIKLYENFDKHFKKYLEVLLPIIESDYILKLFISEKYNVISELISSLKNEIKTNEECFEFDDTIFKIDNLSNHLLNFINKIDLYSIKTITSTSMENIVSETAIINSYNKNFYTIKKDKYLYAIKIFNKILSNISLDEIQSFHIKYNDSILLYKKLMFKRLKKEKRVIDYVDKIKYKLFDDGKTEENFNLLQRFNFTPFVQHISVDELIKYSLNVTIKKTDKKTGGSYDVKNLEKVSDIFKSKRIGVFVLVCICNNPIEFNFSNLLNQKKQNFTEGMSITTDMIDFYSMIKQYKSKYPAILTNYSIGDINSNKWLVVRTIDGEYYDIITNKPCSEFSEVFVTNTVVEKLKRGPSNLIDKYQNNQNELLSNFIREPLVIEIKKYNNPSHNIKNIIYNTLIDYYENKIRENELTLYNLNNIILSQDINNVLLNVLINSFMTLDVNYVPLDMVSFINMMENLIYSYSNEIRDGYIKEEFSEKIFEKYTGLNLFNLIMKKIKDFATLVTNKIFSVEKDIFYNILLHNRLLNINFNN